MKKIIDFGNVYAKIKRLELKNIRPNLYKLNFVLETKEQKNINFKIRDLEFNGLAVFPSLSKYLINLEKDISKKSNTIRLMFILNEINKVNPIIDLNEFRKKKFSSFEDFIEEYKNLNIYNTYLHWAIGAKYAGINANGYMTFYPYLINNDNSNCFVSVDKDNITIIDEKEHIENYDDYIQDLNLRQTENDFTIEEPFETNKETTNKEEVSNSTDNNIDNILENEFGLPF